jgi:hypothetical protein
VDYAHLRLEDPVNPTLEQVAFRVEIVEGVRRRIPEHAGHRTAPSLPVGRIVDATVKSVIERADGLHLQVDYEHDQTALVGEWQVVR